MKSKDRPFALLCAAFLLIAVACYAHSCAQRVEVRR
mgnify:CR=1 FL=1